MDLSMNDPSSQRWLKDRERFMRSIVHDLRAPIRAIVQYLTALHQAAYLMPQHRELLDKAVASATELDAMVVGLRRFHETLGIPGEDLPLRDVIQQTISTYNSRGAIITTQGEDMTLVPPALGIVLGNLIDNASKYGARVIDIRTEIGENEVKLEVSDDGIGFEPDLKERIFDTWYRTPSARHRAEGDGMGLAIGRELVERMGGRIWAESEGPGSGAVFRIVIPLFNGRPSWMPGVSPKAQTILVVDDDKSTRVLMYRLLSSYGDVCLAEGIKEAAPLLATKPFDLVFVDVLLDDGDGAALARTIRRRSRSPLVPVVVMSGTFDNDEEGERVAKSCSASSWLLKPILSERLHALAQQFLKTSNGT